MIKYCRYYDEENKTENVGAYSTLDRMDKEVEEKHTFNGNKVLSFANDIEELFDFIVVRKNNKIKCIITDLKCLNKYEKKHIYLYNVYGALDTDKGLIYVAKMNDKGDLELL